MSGTIRSLLWKEWHEQRWRMAFGCVQMAAFAGDRPDRRILPDIVVLGMNNGGRRIPLADSSRPWAWSPPSGRSERCPAS